MDKYIKINSKDNVVVCLVDIQQGELVCGVVALNVIPAGHKIALVDIKCGQAVLKYGDIIGLACTDIKKGELVHTHNLRTALVDNNKYVYSDKNYPQTTINRDKNAKNNLIKMYPRKSGYGIRNELWVVPTVGCVNGIAECIVKAFLNKFGDSVYGESIDCVRAITHPYGCSQVGKDHEDTKKILRSVVNHPNVGGVLVLGLGCENNQLGQFKEFLGEYDIDRTEFLVCQSVKDEIASGVELLSKLATKMKKDFRVLTDISNLKIGLKCGGSDGFSGITANPLLGRISDNIVCNGGTTVLTEVPEMFGAEHLLMKRACNKNIFNDIVHLVQNFKDYYTKFNQPIYENPSPGNKAGGITTLEEKSLGCTQKSGTQIVQGIVEYGEQLKNTGLNLLNGPGNDIVAVTALGASGCHMVLFSTGRGTPLGGFIPVVKISSNDAIYNFKSNWIDYNAGSVLKNGFENATIELMDIIKQVAEGKKTKAELNGLYDFAIFKTGVTL